MPRSYLMDNRAAATQATRRRILQAALDELVAVGDGSITLQGVATRADLALRTLYNHFPNRDALLGAAFAEHWAETRDLVESVDLPDAEPRDQLRHVVAAYYSRYAEMGPRLTLLLSLHGFPELEEQVRAIRAWRRDVIRRIIHQAEQTGSLTMPESAATALVFTLTSHSSWAAMVNELGDSGGNAALVTSQALYGALLIDRARRRPRLQTPQRPAQSRPSPGE